MMEQLAKQIKLLTERKSQLLIETEQVNLALRSSQARYNSLLNQTNSIAKLPDDLLIRIFQQTRLVQPNRAAPFELVVPLVSGHWRHVALSTPLLWNSISWHWHAMRGRQNERLPIRLAILDAYLTRSTSCPLDMEIQLGDNATALEECMTLIVPQSHRWRRLALASGCDLPPSFLVDFDQLDVPNLQYLSLRCGTPRGSRVRVSGDLPMTFKNHAPSLKCARLAGTVINSFQLPWYGIETFHLDCGPRISMTASHFLSILNSMTSLINLSLTSIYFAASRDPLHINSPATIPTLRSLRIINASSIGHILSLLILPNLESMCLAGLQYMEPFEFPSVRSLTLDLSLFSDERFTPFVTAFPNLTALHLEFPDAEMLETLGGGKSTPPAGNGSGSGSGGGGEEGLCVPFEKLREISVSHLLRPDAEAFHAMLGSRIRRGKRIGLVRLDRKVKALLKARELLDSLMEIAKVERFDDEEVWPSGLGYEDPHDTTWD